MVYIDKPRIDGAQYVEVENPAEDGLCRINQESGNQPLLLCEGTMNKNNCITTPSLQTISISVLKGNDPETGRLYQSAITDTLDLAGFTALRDAVYALRFPTPQREKFECWGWVPTLYSESWATIKPKDKNKKPFQKFGYHRNGASECRYDELPGGSASVSGRPCVLLTASWRVVCGWRPPFCGAGSRCNRPVCGCPPILPPRFEENRVPKDAYAASRKPAMKVSTLLNSSMVC